MKKKKVIMVLVTLVIFILLIVGIILKPKYELNKAVRLLENGDYKIAYTYISGTSNKDNIKIIKELISMKLLENISNGCEQVTTIANKGTEILKKTDINHIDYSLDDRLNIYVKKIEDYINIKDNISKEMIIDELHQSYDLYFEVLEFVNENFMDMLNNIQKSDFINEVLKVSLKLETISVDTTSISDNYNFSILTQKIYKEINS